LSRWVEGNGENCREDKSQWDKSFRESN